MKKIHVSGPSISQKEIDYITDAAKSSWYDNAGQYVKRFEKAFAAYIDRKYAVTLPCCTSGLHLSLLSLGVGQGDEVIVPEITWTATALPVAYVGASPVFADINPTNWCVSVETIERCITPKTKAIIVVDLYGNIPDMDSILELAKKHNIPVIEDAAQAIGAEFKNKKAGSFGDISVFSFHGSKTLVTGEGGMLVTDDESIYKKVSKLKDFGRNKGLWCDEIGYKYKMSDFQAAFGLAQLERIDELVDARIRNFKWYKKALDGVEGIEQINTVSYDVKCTYWMTNIILDKKLGVTKEVLMSHLAEYNVMTRPFFYPLSMQPAYSKYTKDKDYKTINSVAYELSKYGVNLPSDSNLTEEDVNFVVGLIKKKLKEAL
ncbi:DegT/DnrJ/EryC1/StrS family aminotransferase [bacterium]|jgi:perosamine synthetase|nr:DegT/DnrJ/EryC1/StrS family aminotransferase [bacterium]